MKGNDKNQTKKESSKDPLEVFSSEAERLEALERFGAYLAKLKEWDRKTPHQHSPPSAN